MEGLIKYFCMYTYNQKKNITTNNNKPIKFYLIQLRI